MQSKQHLDQSYESFVSKSCSKDCWKPPSLAISEYCPLERAIYLILPSAEGNIRYIALQFPLILPRKVVYTILNNLTPIKFSEYYQLNELSTRSHPLMIYPLPSSINGYRYSFFVNLVFFWNSVSYDVLSAPWTFFKYKLKQFLF